MTESNLAREIGGARLLRAGAKGALPTGNKRQSADRPISRKR